MAMKLKWAKGGFVFRPLYLIPGIFTIYIVHYLDQYGMISLLPQVILGLMGGRWFIKGFYESNNRKFREYQKDHNQRKSNRSFLSLFMVFAMFGLMVSGSGMVAADYWDLPQTFTTEQLDDGWKQNIWTYTDNNTIDNGTFELAMDHIRYYDDFEIYENGNETPDGWEGLPLSSASEVCGLKINDRQSISGQKAMKINPPSSDEIGGIGHLDFINGSLLSFWVYFQKQTSFIVTTQANSVGSPSDITVFANVQFNFDRSITYSIKDQGGAIHYYDTGVSYSNGWHRVEIIHDMLNLTYDVRFDGALLIDSSRSHDVYLGTYIRFVNAVEFFLQYESIWIDDFQIGEDAHFRQGVWQSQYVLTDAWLVQPYIRENVRLGVSNITAASGNQSIRIQDFNSSDAMSMEHYFKPHGNLTFEFDINFTSKDPVTIDKFHVWCRSLTGARHVYFFWIQSVTNPGYFESWYFDGVSPVMMELHREGEWHHVEIDVDCATGTYDLFIDDSPHLDLAFAYGKTTEISSFEFSTSWSEGADSVFLDNFVFTTNGTEFVNDTFEDDVLGQYPGGGGLDPDHYLEVQYRNVTNSTYIDRIEFTQPSPTEFNRDIVFAAYDVDIKDGDFVNITESMLTRGSFQDLNVSTWYFIKIYLVSNGTETCNVGSFGSEVVFRDIGSYSHEEDDGYFGPRWGGSSVPSFQQPWYNQILAMLEANTGLLLAGVLFLLALTLLAGESRRRR